MIIQIINIASGVAIVAQKQLAISPANQKTIGLIELVVGVAALISRIGSPMLITVLGASYPQAIAAILMGLLLAQSFFEPYPQIRSLIASLKPYGMWIGAAGIIVGLASIF